MLIGNQQQQQPSTNMAIEQETNIFKIPLTLTLPFSQKVFSFYENGWLFIYLTNFVQDVRWLRH